MAKTIDIFAPEISQISKGVEGKLILIHSNERKLGKTLQATRFPKPYYLRFEQGINAISGLAYAPLTKWADFKRVRKQLTNPKTLDKARATYSTIIVDTVDVAIKWCEKYICNSQGVDRLNDGNSGYGLWKEYENEWFNEWNSLLNAGYCVIFISHSEVRKQKDPKTSEEYEQLYPKGDKRTIDLIIDAVDFIGYVKSNGYDEDGNSQLSSIYFQSCPEYLAGSRFKYMATEITPFTAESVQEAIVEAVIKEEEATGSKAITYDQKFEELQQENQNVPFDELMDKAKVTYREIYKINKEITKEIIAKYLGEEGKLSRCTEKQYEQVMMIIDDFEEYITENG